MDTQDQNVPTEGTTDVLSQENEGIDYKAELEAAQKRAQEAEERLKKAEFTLKKKNLDGKKGDDHAPSVIDEEKLDQLLEDKLSQRLNAIRAAETVDDVDDVLSLLTDNDDEKALIRHIYDNRIAKSGYSRSQIRDDLITAQLIANAKKFQKENTELAASMAARASLGTAPYGSNVKKNEVKDDYKKAFSDSDLQYMRSRGWSEDMIKTAAQNILTERNR